MNDGTHSESFKEVVGIVISAVKSAEMARYDMVLDMNSPDLSSPNAKKDHIRVVSGEHDLIHIKRIGNGRVVCKFENEEGQMERLCDPSTMPYEKALKETVKKAKMAEISKKVL